MSNYQPLHRYDYFKISTYSRILINLNSFYRLGTHHSYSIFVNTTPAEYLMRVTRHVRRRTLAIVPLAGFGVLVHKLACEVIKSHGPWLPLVRKNNEGHEKPSEVARQAKYHSELHSTVTAWGWN